MNQHNLGVKRLHVLRGAQGTVIVILPMSRSAVWSGWAARRTEFPAMTAAAKRKVLSVARRAGLQEPVYLAATCPIQSPQVLQQMGLPALTPAVVSGVTFTSMPDGKPSGGFLEIGDCAPGEDTYPWEGNVELLLGSDQRVYALVTETVDALPLLNDEGRAVSKEDDDA